MEEDKKTTKSEITFLDLVSILWKNRWLIVLGTMLTMIFTYVVVKFFVGETYRASATLVQLYSPIQTQTPPINLSIDSIQELLKSPDLINAVVNKLKLKEKHPDLKTDQLIKQLKTQTVVEEDTSISRRVSPLIQISGVGTTRKESMDFTNTWAETFIERYGKLIATRIENDYFVLKGKNDKLKDELKTLGEQRVKLINEIKYYDSLFSGKNQELIDRTSELDYVKTEAESVLSQINQYKKSLEEEITFKTEQGAEKDKNKKTLLGDVEDKENLIYLHIKQQIIDLEAYYKSLLSKKIELEKTTSNLENEINNNIITTLSGKKLELETAILNYENKFAEYDELKKFLASAEIEYGRLKGLEGRGSFGAYYIYLESKAIEPDLRESPKRALVTLIAGFLAFLFLSGISFFKEYIPKVS